MLVLVIVLVATNLIALGALGYLLRRRLRPVDLPGLDDAAAAALDRAPRPTSIPAGTRRLITIEILNPIELAGTRGRIAGIAGSMAPRLTRRIVYEQTYKQLKEQLADQQVVADVRLHTLVPMAEATPAESRLVEVDEAVDPVRPDDEL